MFFSKLRIKLQRFVWFTIKAYLWASLMWCNSIRKMQPILVLVGLKKKNRFLFTCLLKCERGIWKFPKDKNICCKPLLCLDTCRVKVGEGLERNGVAEDPTMPSPPLAGSWCLNTVFYQNITVVFPKGSWSEAVRGVEYLDLFPKIMVGVLLYPGKPTFCEQIT